MGAAGETVLEVRNLKVYFPVKKGVFARTVGYVKAVDGVSFALRRGETLGIVGESGSGKTTAARVVAGLQKATAGDVRLNGRVAMVFQDPLGSLNPRLTTRATLAEVLRLNRTTAFTPESLLETVGLSGDALDRYPHEFSGGQRQRICIARALAARPDVLICDEAVSALDISIRATVLDLLEDLKRKLSLSLLFITHDLGVVQHVADRILVMHRGRVVEEGAAEEVLRRPKDGYTKALLAAVPRILASLAVAAGLASSASGLTWEAVALTPSLVRLTAEDTAAERARFLEEGLPLVTRLTGWRLNVAMNEAARKAQAPRQEVIRRLRAAHSNVWHEAVGQTFLPGPDGVLRDVRAADVRHVVWLPLARPLAPGETTTLALGNGDRVPFTYDDRAPSPLFKVNQVGYVASARRKYAYLGAWLGTGGPFRLPFDAKNPPAFELRDAASGRVVFSGRVRRRFVDPVSPEGTPWTGEETWEMDFSSVEREGAYCLFVAGVGRSDSFRIAADAARDAFRVHLAGLRSLRCGATCHRKVRRGTFPPDDSEYRPAQGRDFGFFEISGKPAEVYHFRLIEEAAPDAGEEIAVPGGWHDAADYDRRPYHLTIVNDLLALARVRPDLPEALDEAEWGLGHLIAAQQGDGGVGTWIETTRHPTPGEGPNSERGLKYYLSRATRVSSLEYAATAAALAVVLRSNGRTNWTAWAASARRAWDYAHDPSHDKMAVFSIWGKMVAYRPRKTLPPDQLFKAGFNLMLLGGDAAAGCEEELTKNADAINAALAKPYWKWSPLRFIETDKFALRVPDALEPGVKAWQSAVLETAERQMAELDSAYPYRTPWYESGGAWASGMSWGTAHPLRRGLAFVAAHVLTGQRRWLDALALCNDFHNGANPMGETLTCGLGLRHPTRFLELERNYRPGITPYRWTYGVPQEDRELVHSDEDAARWPIWLRFSNIESLTVANSEFSGLETIAPAAVSTGYLTPARKPAPGAAARKSAP